MPYRDPKDKTAWAKRHYNRHTRPVAGPFNHQLAKRLSTRLRVECRKGRLTLTEMAHDRQALLGCSYSQWAQHLGLCEGDTLDSSRHLDHIIPVCAYNLNDPEDLKNCFNYQNTQILTDKENGSKGHQLPNYETLMKLKHLWPKAWRGEFPSIVALPKITCNQSELDKAEDLRLLDLLGW